MFQLHLQPLSLRRHTSAAEGELIDEAFAHQAVLRNFRSPNLAFLQEWMARPSMANVYFLGQDCNVWFKIADSDLSCLKMRLAGDPTSRWVTDRAVHWWQPLVVEDIFEYPVIAK